MLVSVIDGSLNGCVCVDSHVIEILCALEICDSALKYMFSLFDFFELSYITLKRNRVELIISLGNGNEKVTLFRMFSSNEKKTRTNRDFFLVSKFLFFFCFKV